ncbi:hypothetical protein MED92_06438 [Oceanospirillum sp. MED92]|uniref:Uncharacterized protein n=1 Tax=Neptuniibacter caesariensis TaxID=207954 RepID=A0A7U8C9S5_NEPCE|nr:hypothetical protein MED92_06438 [Oceanospirillum sp. MED92] [Neptuniibacter caesariensis]
MAGSPSINLNGDYTTITGRMHFKPVNYRAIYAWVNYLLSIIYPLNEVTE